MLNSEHIIFQTKNWIQQVVIGCNFCPFAKKELHRGSIHFEIIRVADLKICIESVIQECQRLDANENIETTLLIFPEAFAEFDEFLKLLAVAEKSLIKNDYEGIYQLASFHPDYCFAGASADDPANFTNRSLYPMLHLLRENSLTNALENYPNPENIPEQNIKFARKKGLAHMKALQNACRTLAD